MLSESRRSSRGKPNSIRTFSFSLLELWPATKQITVADAVNYFAGSNPVRAKSVKTPQQWKSSFGATAGLTRAHRCLTTDDILGQFGQQKASAQRKYREFVKAGIEKVSIWEDVKAQSVLGVEGFAEALLDHVTGKREIREIPKGQRFLGRPALDKLFDGVRDRKRTRDGVIAAAVKRYGYSQMEVANYLRLHYSTISRLIKMIGETSKVKT